MAGTGPATVDFVAAHTGWHHRNARLLGRSTQPLGRNTQWIISQWEHSSSAHPTPQLGAGSGAERSWESPGTEAAQLPGGSTTASIPPATAPWPPEPAHSTPESSTRSGTSTTEKGIKPWADSGQSHGHRHQAAHRFAVTTQASLASAVTSFGTKHAFKDHRPSRIPLQ